MTSIHTKEANKIASYSMQNCRPSFNKVLNLKTQTKG